MQKHILYEPHLRETSSLFPPSQLLRKRGVKSVDNHISAADPNGGDCPHPHPQQPRKGNREINHRTRLHGLCVFALPAKVWLFQGEIFLASNGSEALASPLRPPMPPNAPQALGWSLEL